MNVRNPIRDQISIVGVGSTGFVRTAQERSSASLAAQASISAIRDAGLGAGDIDGIIVTAELGAPTPWKLAAVLGLDDIRFFQATGRVFVDPIITAMNAIFAGSATTILICHPVLRMPWASRSAAADPFRLRLPNHPPAPPESVSGAVGYTAWAGRYMHEYGARREHFGYVAINDRSNAMANPLAAARTPLTMTDYLTGRMIREPLCIYDMDLPVDGADAFVLTTTERARDLPHRPVMIHAATHGLVRDNDEEQLRSLHRHGQHVAIEALRAKSDLWLNDVDVYFAYDGFTIITLAWIENVGWCGPGEAGPFLEDHWNAAAGRVEINGRVPLNPHGGALSEGATRGSGYFREAVHQLRREGGSADRQVPNATVAMLNVGGFFFNSQSAILRSE